MSNFNKTQMQGMMRATKVSRNKNQSRTGNSSAQSSIKAYQDRTQEYFGATSNGSKANSIKKQMLQSVYSNSKLN